MLPDVCRAIAVAALGPAARAEFKSLELPDDEQALNGGAFDVLFLTGEGKSPKRARPEKCAPGPAVFFNSYAVMVEKGSAAATLLEDLAGAPICLHEADPAAEALAEYFGKKGKSFIAMPFQEDVEWRDAYNSRHCRAAAAEMTDLIDLRLRQGVNRFDSVLLPEKLGGLSDRRGDAARRSALDGGRRPNRGFPARGGRARPARRRRSGCKRTGAPMWWRKSATRARFRPRSRREIALQAAARKCAVTRDESRIGADDGTRTRTLMEKQILSLLRLPISPRPPALEPLSVHLGSEEVSNSLF